MLFGFQSCEKVIDLPVNDAEEVLVVEAVLKDVPNASYILLSKTGTVYDNSGFKKVTDANVLVSDDLGNTFQFLPDLLFPGRYVNSSFIVTPNRTYYLNIEDNGDVVTADASSRTKPKIDSLTYVLEDFGLANPDLSFYLVSYHALDKVNEKNSYRLRIWINNDEVDTYYLGNDEFINGQNYEAPFFGSDPNLGDTVRIEMLEMNRALYEYFYGLSGEVGGSSFSASPANPTTNLNGKALGYFGVFMTDTASIIIQ